MLILFENVAKIIDVEYCSLFLSIIIRNFLMANNIQLNNKK